MDLKPGTTMGVLLNNDVTYSNNPRSGAYATYPASSYKTYTYQGNSYVLKRSTGVRTLLR